MKDLILHPGQVSVEQAFKLELTKPEMIIRSTYFDEDDDKMPIEYDTVEEALYHEERYGSIWLGFPDGSRLQVAPDFEVAYLKKFKKE